MEKDIIGEKFRYFKSIMKEIKPRAFIIKPEKAYLKN